MKIWENIRKKYTLKTVEYRNCISMYFKSNFRLKKIAYKNTINN